MCPPLSPLPTDTSLSHYDNTLIIVCVCVCVCVRLGHRDGTLVETIEGGEERGEEWRGRTGEDRRGEKGDGGAPPAKGGSGRRGTSGRLEEYDGMCCGREPER